jgi:hypothetical protein
VSATGGRVEQVLEMQLRGSLGGLAPKDLAEIVIAYEPGVGHWHGPHGDTRAGAKRACLHS